MAAEDEPAGSARLELVDGVTLLHQDDVVFEAMLSGWTKQMHGRRLRPDTMSGYVETVRRFTRFINEYPWNWTAAHMDEWSMHLLGVQNRTESTIRNYHGAVRMFCEFITSPHYRWSQECLSRFGTHPVQICHEWNTSAHLVDY